VAAHTFYSATTFSNLINGNSNLAPIGVSDLFLWDFHSDLTPKVWNGFGSLCDIVIALTMPYYIMRHGTGLRKTHIVIVRLIRLIFETGIFTGTYDPIAKFSHVRFVIMFLFLKPQLLSFAFVSTG
jgi:hypothetical protein